MGFNRFDSRSRLPIWIHAVSVGEAVSIKNILNLLHLAYPDKGFVISTVTSTGNQIAQGLARKNDLVTYLPLDFSFTVNSVLDKIKPCAFIITETELWPNLIACLYKRKIPVILINGRISPRSFKRYFMVRFLLKMWLNRVSLFCVQTPRDAERLLQLGVLPDKVKVTGNMKFDFIHDKVDTDDLRHRLALDSKDKILVAGSTHQGEEEIILGVYKKILTEFPGSKLIIAPRHPERAKVIAEMVSGFGFRPVLFSILQGKCKTCLTVPVVIVDTIGELMKFYSIADIVFVGGSLIKKGGHNILEPAVLAKPVIFGAHMFNFADIADLFLENKAAVMVNNQEELKCAISKLLQDPGSAKVLGNRARELILQNQGATQKNLELIKKYL